MEPEGYGLFPQYCCAIVAELPFLELDVRGWSGNVFEGYIEAWVGRPNEDAVGERTSACCDFWRASPAGQLYTIRGYTEDDLMGSYTYNTGRPVGPGEVIDLTYPVRRVTEGLFFAERFGSTFGEVDGISMSVRFTGLRNRRLISLTKSRGYHENRISDTDEVVLEAQARSLVRRSLSLVTGDAPSSEKPIS